MAVFTATSALTGTGLVVVDTGTYWSTFGQAVIMILVLLGGIGSRTRRGCGSLFLKASNPQLLTCDQLMAAVKSVEGNHRPWGIPRLKDAAALRPMLANPMPHWQCWPNTVCPFLKLKVILWL